MYSENISSSLRGQADHEGEPMAVGVALHNQKQLGLRSEKRTEASKVVLQGGSIHLDPGKQTVAFVWHREFPPISVLALTIQPALRAPITDDGCVVVGLSQPVASIIDFSFVRSVAADAYPILGALCHDSVSIFVHNLYRSLCNSVDNRHFCSILHDPG
jgi:hypothetical protein